MRRWSVSVAAFLLGLLSVLGHTAPSKAQIKWNVTYKDVVNGTGKGFNDPTVLSGESKSLGTLRQNSVTAALDYLNTVLDGRGTVELQFDTSASSGSGFLASFGPRGFSTFGVPGSFQNGQAYQAARTNTRTFSAPDAAGQFNFGHTFNYAGQQNAKSGSAYDMVSVAIHEFAHGNGFLNLVNQSGQGLTGNAVGTTGLYGVYDSYLLRGNGPNATPLFNTNVANSNYASFANPSLTTTFTNGNNETNGLFFGGQYAMETYGGPVPLYAPTSFAPGSSIGHDNTSPPGVMNFNITQNTERRFLTYEIGMLIDLGWNNYNWNNTTANWLDGANGPTLVVADSKWRTNLGLTRVGDTNYNSFNFQNQAPVLPPSGQVTSNIVLNFGGSGSSEYTSTNDIGTVRLARLNLNSTSTGTNTITGGTLLFGQDAASAGGNQSVLFPKIVQQNSGRFVIASNIQIPSQGLNVEGPGSGQVTLSGTISGDGEFAKFGTFPLVLTGANTYTGGTVIRAGTVFANNFSGSATGTNFVLVDTGATLRGLGTISGEVGVNPGGTIRGGSEADPIQPLTINNTVTIHGSSINPGTLAVDLDGTTFSGVLVGQLALNNGVLNLHTDGETGGPIIIGLLNAGGLQWNNPYSYIIVTGQADGFHLNGTPVTAYTYGSDFVIKSSSFGDVADVSLEVNINDDLILTFTPVPEPATVLGIGLAGLGVFRLVRCRRRITHPLHTPASST